MVDTNNIFVSEDNLIKILSTKEKLTLDIIKDLINFEGVKDGNNIKKHINKIINNESVSYRLDNNTKVSLVDNIGQLKTLGKIDNGKLGESITMDSGLLTYDIHENGVLSILSRIKRESKKSHHKIYSGILYVMGGLVGSNKKTYNIYYPLGDNATVNIIKGIENYNDYSDLSYILSFILYYKADTLSSTVIKNIRSYLTEYMTSTLENTLPFDLSEVL